ncbi:MAG: hypothetical protein GX665_10245 [Gammaproteobacteria bacterium]|nr:hypothetical protein [Gammaproteobacteria bacterium]
MFASNDPELSEKIRALTGGKGARLVFDPVGGPSAKALFRAMAYEGIYFQYGALRNKQPVCTLESIYL